MRTLTTQAQIWDSDQFQTVDIEYSGLGFNPFTVDYLKVLTPIELEPSDLIIDLANAIEKHLNIENVRIECDVLFLHGIPTICKPEYEVYHT